MNRDGLLRRAFVGIRGLRRVVLIASPLALLLILAAAGGASAADAQGLGDATQALAALPPVDPAPTVAPAAGLTATKDRAVGAAGQTIQVEPQKAVVETVRKAGAEPASVVDPIVPAAVPPGILADPFGPFAQARRAGTPRRPEARATAAAIGPAAVSADPWSAIAGDQPAATRTSTHARSFEATTVLGLAHPGLPVAPAGAASDAAIGGSGSGPGPWLALMLLPLVGVAWRSIVRVMALFRIPPGMTPRFAVPPG